NSVLNQEELQHFRELKNNPFSACKFLNFVTKVNNRHFSHNHLILKHAIDHAIIPDLFNYRNVINNNQVLMYSKELDISFAYIIHSDKSVTSVLDQFKYYLNHD